VSVREPPYCGPIWSNNFGVVINKFLWNLSHGGSDVVATHIDNTITRKQEQSKTDIFQKKLFTNKNVILIRREKKLRPQT
jgi:hypothetical protein